MSKLSLFLIDDSKLVNLTTSKVVKTDDRIGQVTCYTNAQIALDQILNDSKNGNALPDLIFLDIHMPKMNGFEWIDEIDYNFDEFKPIVILVSSTNQLKDFESLQKQRLGKEIISKPITSDILDGLINKYFQNL